MFVLTRANFAALVLLAIAALVTFASGRPPWLAMTVDLAVLVALIWIYSTEAR